jgi:DNA-binding response OmpR family regulator
MNILLLEDDKNLHLSLKSLLELEQFNVTSAFDSDDVYELTYNKHYDLYIFDVNVCGDNGFEILKSLKQSGDTTKTIYITALHDISSIEHGFKAGADDYIKKPFDPKELIIRIKNRYMNNDLKTYKDLTYNYNNKELKRGDKVIPLSNRLSILFDELIIRKNQITPFETLYNTLGDSNANALRVSISKLKLKLSLDIKNIRSIGYMLEEL